MKAPECCPDTVNEAELIEIVKTAICRQATLLAEMKELLKLHQEMIKKEQGRIKREKVELENKIQKCQDEKFLLYERYKKEEISREEFQEYRQKNQKRLEVYQKQLNSYEEEKDKDDTEGESILALLEGKEKITELTKEVVDQLISAIYVYGKRRVEIIFKFKDEMENLLDLARIPSFRKEF